MRTGKCLAVSKKLAPFCRPALHIRKMAGMDERICKLLNVDEIYVKLSKLLPGLLAWRFAPEVNVSH